MTIFWMNLGLVYVISLFSRYFSVASTAGPIYFRPNKMLAAFVMMLLVMVAGLRNNIGDTYLYMHGYVVTEFTWMNLDFNRDFGFHMLQMFLQRVSRDPQLMIFVTAFLTNVLIVAVLYHYSRLFELSIFVYITSNMYLTSMNGLRQYLAAAILFAGTKYLLNGDWKKYFAIVLLASTIHKSALILIPIYFVVRGKAWSKQTFFLICGTMFIVIGFNQFTGMLFNAIEGTQYGHYREFAEGGANVIRVAVFAAPLVIAFLARNKLKSLVPAIDPVINMSLINCLFMIVSTQNWIFARFSIYFGLYQLILISWIPKLFKERDQSVIYYLIVVCYLMYYFYECVISFGTQYRSDYFQF